MVLRRRPLRAFLFKKKEKSMLFEFSFCLNSLSYAIHYSSSLLMVTYLRMFPVLTQSPIRFLPISNFPRTKNLVKCKVALRLEKLVLYRFFVVDRWHPIFSDLYFKNNLLDSYYFKGIPSPKVEAIDTIELITPSILVNFSNGFLAFSLSPFSM